MAAEDAHRKLVAPLAALAIILRTCSSGTLQRLTLRQRKPSPSFPDSLTAAATVVFHQTLIERFPRRVIRAIVATRGSGISTFNYAFFKR